MNKGVTKKRIRAIRWILFLLLSIAPRMICAQDTLPPISSVDTLIWANDTVFSPVEGEAIIAFSDTLLRDVASNDKKKNTQDTPPFKPVPRTAVLASTIFPGVGQIYNRQYWKLPIVYGGLMGCAYAISWNNRTYQDYRRAYYSIMKDAKADPGAEHPENWSENWMVFVPGSIDPATRLHNTAFHSNLKRGKDYFLRYRDLSIIIGLLVYGICIADAYVDAQMFDFDISPDLTFQVTPVYVPETLLCSRSYGINICMTF